MSKLNTGALSLMGIDPETIDFEQINYREYNLKRARSINEWKGDRKKQSAVREFYSRNPVAFINDLCYTYDPRRKKNKVIPFIMFERQAEYIEALREWYVNQEDGLIEKCRDVGASWMNVCFTVWLFVFEKECAILWGANRFDLVDKLDDMDSMFEKMNHVLQHLPDFIRPTYTRHIGRIINKDNGAQITGQYGKNIGRGGRSSISFIDEAAFIEDIDKVDASLSMNTDCQVWLSTPNGQNLFYRKRMGGAYKVFTFHWYQDPRKNQAWYDKQKHRLLPHVFAQEVLIDYASSVENQMIKNEWVNSAVAYVLKGSGAKIIGYDVADEGSDKFAQVGRHGSNVTFAEDWLKLESHAASTRRVWAKAKTERYTHISYDSIGVGVGAKVEFDSLIEHEGIDVIHLHVQGVNVGSSPTDGDYEDTDVNCKDMFTSLKAELWWKLRRRFEKTHEQYMGLANYDEDELISLHDIGHGELTAELTGPKFIINENGKIGIESKKDMAKRGLMSPNLADALILSFAPLDITDYSSLL